MYTERLTHGKYLEKQVSAFLKPAFYVWYLVNDEVWTREGASQEQEYDDKMQG